jgi:hypothetical protein
MENPIIPELLWDHCLSQASTVCLCRRQTANEDPTAADNTPPVFDQKYGGTVELNTKKEPNGL